MPKILSCWYKDMLSGHMRGLMLWPPLATPPHQKGKNGKNQPYLQYYVFPPLYIFPSIQKSGASTEGLCKILIG